MGDEIKKEEAIRSSRLTAVILTAMMIVAFLYGIVALKTAPEQIERITVAGSIILLGIGGHILLRRGRVKMADYLVSSLLWLIVTLAAVYSGGVFTPSFSSYTIVILIAGLLLGTRVGVITAVLSMAVSAIILWFQLQGVLPEPVIETTAVSMWGGLTGNFIFAAVLLHLAVSQIQNSLAQARRHRQAVVQANQQLERQAIALRTSEQNFRDLVENLMDGVAIADENARHIYVNSKFSEITGYSRDELLSMTGWDFTRPEDRAELQQKMKDRMAGKLRQKQYERIVVRKDGTEIFVEISTTTTTWQGEKRPMAIIRDITERKQAEAKIQNINAELEERVRERTAELRKLVAAMAGREVRMAELKKVVRALRQQLQQANLVPIADDPLVDGGSLDEDDPSKR